MADAAIRLGMHVIGYDPDITVDAAWSLPAQVRKAHSVAELLKASHFVSIHVPLVAATKHLINAQALETMRPGAVLLNFSREGVVDDNALLAALAAERLRCYVCDFTGPAIHRHPRAIDLPHLDLDLRQRVTAAQPPRQAAGQQVAPHRRHKTTSHDDT